MQLLLAQLDRGLLEGRRKSAKIHPLIADTQRLNLENLTIHGGDQTAAVASQQLRQAVVDGHAVQESGSMEEPSLTVDFGEGAGRGRGHGADEIVNLGGQVPGSASDAASRAGFRDGGQDGVRAR